MDKLTSGNNCFDEMRQKHKYVITGIVREPLIKTTGKNGYDYIFAYQIKDENNNTHTRHKDEIYILARAGFISNATYNYSTDGLHGVGCDLRKLPEVVANIDYLTNNEMQIRDNNLNEIIKLLNSRNS